jgi:energy-coupling factor transporter ATP-binding protein EcfA2
MKTHNNSSGVWYGSDQLSSLIKWHAPNVNVLMPASVLLGFSKQLDQIGQDGQYFIPLNINCLSQNFEDDSRNDLKNNHWAGLYVVKNNYQTSVTYLDPMGKVINPQLAFEVKNKLGTNNIVQPLLNKPIQYVQFDSTRFFIEKGDDVDCGPFLVYCVTAIANGKGVRQDINTLEQSVSFGQYLRDAFSKQVSFDEIYQTSSDEPTKNKATKEFEQYKLDEFGQWYTPQVVEYLTHLNTQDVFLRYVFFDKGPEDFKNQLESICAIKNFYGNNPKVKGISFISKEPGLGENHFVYGTFIGNKLIIINPVGETEHVNFYEALSEFKKVYKEVDIFLSNTILQKDGKFAGSGLVSCGPICIELMRYISLLPIEKIVQLTETGTESSKYGLNYKEISIAAILPDTLSALLNPDSDGDYMARVIEIRESHHSILSKYPSSKTLSVQKQNELLDAQCTNHPMQCTVKSHIQDKGMPKTEIIDQYLNSQGSLTAMWKAPLGKATSPSIKIDESQTIPPAKSSATMVKKKPLVVKEELLSKAIPPSIKIIEPKLPEIKEEINDAEIPQINEIIKKIELGNKQIHSKAEKAILVIGKTGAGKSTLVNYLTNPENLEVVLNKEPENEYDEGTLVIDVIGPKKANSPKIGHNKDSETTIPNKWQSKDGELIYWDPPGFGNTKGPEQEIPDAFYIKKIFDIAKQIKLMLTITYSDLENSRANDIKELADTLGNLFNKDEIKKIIKGLSFVVTKAGQEITERRVKAEIVKILKTESFKEDSVGKIILESLRDSQNKIAIFKKPKEEGALTKGENGELLGNNNNILKIIESTSFIATPKVNIAVSAGSKNETSKLCKELNSLIAKESERIAEWFKFYCKKSIKKQDKAVLPNIQQSIETNEEFIKCISKCISDTKGDTKRVNNIKKYIEYIDFLKQIGSKEITYQANDWAKPLLDAGKTIRSWLEVESDLREDGCLEVKGVLIDSSKVMEKFRSQQDKKAIKSIEVYAGNTVFLDEDLRDDDLYLKGKNVAIIAPRWKVVGKKIIDLSGREGDKHKTPKAKDAEPVAQHQEIGIVGKPGNPGEDGLPGLPGYNGGNFFGAGKKFIGLEGLTIDVSGGKGGKGQDGGKGSNGTNSTKDGDKQAVVYRETKALKSATECMLRDDTVHRICEEYESRGVNGGIGGSGGMGGKGGIGGYAGQILLKSSTFLKPQVLLLSQEGDAGAPGDPGQGGDNDRIYYGKYVNEKVVYTAAVRQLAFEGRLIGEGVKTSLATSLAISAAIFLVGITIGGVAGLVEGKLGIVQVVTVIGGTGLMGVALAEGVLDKTDVGSKVLKSYKHSGWQGEIKHRVEKASAGWFSKEKNSLSIEYPVEPDRKWINDPDQIITRYREYVKGVDKYLVKEVTDFSSLKDTAVCIGKYAAEQLPTPYKVTKTTEQKVKVHSSDNQSEFDPRKNAFNQKENINYYYQTHDLELIQEMIMGSNQSRFIIHKLIRNKLSDHCAELRLKFAEQDKPCLSIVDIGNCNWINIGLLKVQKQLTLSIISNFSEEGQWRDSGVLALRNMEIAAKKILNNPDVFAQDVQNYRGFCTLEKVPGWRIDFGKQYALAVYRQMVENVQKNVILESCSNKDLESGLVKLKEGVQKAFTYEHYINAGENSFSTYGYRTKVILLKTWEKLDKENQQTISRYGGTEWTGSAVVIKSKVMNFDMESNTFEYCYKISWTQDLNSRKNMFNKLRPHLSKQPGKFIEDEEHHVINFIPPKNSSGYDRDLSELNISIDLDKLCKKLNVEPTSDLCAELEKIIQNRDVGLMASDSAAQSSSDSQEA